MGVGDAAGQVKPTTGGGIYFALLCGDMAANTIYRALDKGDTSHTYLKQYERSWKERLAKELRIGYYARRLYELFRDRQIDQVHRVIGANGIHQELIESTEVSFDWHGDFIVKAVGHEILGGLINSLRGKALSGRNRE